MKNINKKAMNIVIRKPLVKNAIALLLIITAIIASKTEGTAQTVFSVLAGILFIVTFLLLVDDILQNNRVWGRLIVLALSLLTALVFYEIWNN